MNVAITGATGLIGRALLNDLSHGGCYKITALTRNLGELQERGELSNVRWIKGDLRSDADCKLLVTNQDVVVHLAHTNSPLTSEKDIVSDATLNLVPTLTLLKAIESEQRGLHVVFASSGGAVYGGSTDKVLFKESDACLPDSSYGIQKLTVELYLRNFVQRGILSANALRIANAYGRVLNPERLQGLIGTSVYHLLKGDPIHVIGNPDNVRDYVHLDDIVASIKASMTYRRNFRILNIGSGIGYSVTQVINLIASILERPVERIQDNATAGKYLPNWCVLDIERAHAEINWKPKINLETGVARLLNQAGLLRSDDNEKEQPSIT
jgi:UDP-glucose 4-epimerase